LSTEAAKIIFKFNQNSHRVINAMNLKRQISNDFIIDEELVRIKNKHLPKSNQEN
jgi:hypothetical protein